MTAQSVSADAIRKAYIDEATKQALLGPGNSFGLPRSTITTFKVSELEEGPVVLIPAMAGKMIVPLQAMCGTGMLLSSDISANLGWLAPEDDDSAHNEPWLSAATPLFFAGEELGSLVLLPNSGAMPAARLWPECVRDRPFAVGVPDAGGAARSTKSKKRGKVEDEPRAEEKDEAEAESRYKASKSAGAREVEEPVDPDLSIVVFYTVF